MPSANRDELLEERGPCGGLTLRIVLGGVAGHVARAHAVFREVIGDPDQLAHGGARVEQSVGYFELGFFDPARKADLPFTREQGSRGDLTEVGIERIPRCSRGAVGLDGGHDC